MENACKVVIVGGGSAGWMTAAYLVKALAPQVEIQLIESSSINTIGVGEATFSTIHLFFEFLGLAEEDWMHECNASYKIAIRFVNWNKERQHFYHPFQRLEIVHGRSIAEWWLKLKSDVPFDYACYTVPRLIDARRAPRYPDGRVFDSRVEGCLGPEKKSNAAWALDDLLIQYPYAFHFDASLLAKFMCGYACKRGVQQIIDDVIDIKLDENGSISAIQTKDHGSITGDLYIDCTGFRGLLINQALKEPFIPFGESLPCTSAVAMRVPWDAHKDGIDPCTTATALSAGWVWNIPLFHRVGTGYVYSSAFLSPDEAEAELRRHLGPRAEGCTASHIKMRVGRNRNSWVKNCVAIGLSSGFVEPLESTGIFFIQHGIEQLVNYFHAKTHDKELVKSYNRAVAECIDGVREFLTLHYVTSSRDDTAFWKATKHDFVVPDALAERLRLWKRRLPTNRTINSNFHGFEAYSYTTMLLGLGYWPTRSLPALDSIPAEKALAAFESIRSRSEHLMNTLPSQYEYLSRRYAQNETYAATGD